MDKKEARASIPIWNGADYVRVPEGRYQAIATRHQGPEWAYTFRRWTLLVEFELLSESKCVCAFYNFGENRNQPKITRQGNYFKAWAKANGELPRKSQEMSADVFLEGQVFTVEVRDCRRDAKERDKTEAEVYSVVREIVSVARPSLVSPNRESLNQESGIMQSHNQAINQSSRPGSARGQKVASSA